MKFVYAQFILMFVFACGNEERSTKESRANEMVMDSVNKNVYVSNNNVVQDPLIDSLVNYFKATTQLPISISAKNIDALKPKLKLRAYEVKKMSGKFIQSALSKKCEYYIHRFCKIDSIKQLGEYKSWKLQTELGEIIKADAYAICKVKIDEFGYLLFWMLDESTAEACPYSWGKLVFVTVVNKNEMSETILFAEHSSSGDAPVSYDKKISGSISKDLMFYHELREELDEDEPLVKLTEWNYDLKLVNGVFKCTNEGSKVMRKVRKEVTK